MGGGRLESTREGKRRAYNKGSPFPKEKTPKIIKPHHQGALEHHASHDNHDGPPHRPAQCVCGGGGQTRR